MADQPTCGQGLAEHAALPAKLGELTAAVADVLEGHLKGLDLSDQNSRREYDVYLDLARRHRRMAHELQATAVQMAGYRDLPMGRHDEQALSGPAALGAFERFVTLEQELAALLRQRLDRDRSLLVAMRRLGD